MIMMMMMMMMMMMVMMMIVMIVMIAMMVMVMVMMMRIIFLLSCQFCPGNSVLKWYLMHIGEDGREIPRHKSREQ